QPLSMTQHRRCPDMGSSPEPGAAPAGAAPAGAAPADASTRADDAARCRTRNVTVVTRGLRTSTATDPRLGISGVSCRVGETQALAATDLVVDRGEFVSVVGPSGCGKSTLFNVISGLEPPATGSIEVSGHDVTGQTGHVGYMLQKDLMLPWRTVIGNIV